MKNTKLAIAILLVLWFAGCVKPEAENMEADILRIKLPDSVLVAPPVISNTTVRAFVKFEKMDIKAFAPEIELTPGATITPESGAAPLMKSDFQSVDFKLHNLFANLGLIYHF